MTGLKNSIFLAASLLSVTGLISSAFAQEAFKPQFSATEMKAVSSPTVKTSEPAILVSWLKEPAHSNFVPYTLEVASFRHLGSVVNKPRVSEFHKAEYSKIDSCVDAGLLKAPSFANEAISCEELAPEMPESAPAHIAHAGAQSFAANGAGAAE